MNLEERIELLSWLGSFLKEAADPRLEAIKQQAYIKNGWFTIENINASLDAIAQEFLDHKKLTEWISDYSLDNLNPKTIGIVMAGNIPLVSFHDLLCCFIVGHKTIIKYSHKDEDLIPFLVSIMAERDGRIYDLIVKVDRLKDFDAVIATGGDTAAVHFEYYFSKYPHIIRKNRSSIAILDGSESPEDIANLGVDVFSYFGLGCRSISKIYIPTGFNTDRIFEGFYKFKDVIDHNKYKNNFDYNHAIYILGQEVFLTNEFIILKEEKNIASRIACLHYEFYDDLEILQKELIKQRELLQCVSSKRELNNWPHIGLGQCQKPGLNDYADFFDTIHFLTNL